MALVPLSIFVFPQLLLELVDDLFALLADFGPVLHLAHQLRLSLRRLLFLLLLIVMRVLVQTLCRLLTLPRAELPPLRGPFPGGYG